jgi:hypothetical protein
MDTVYINPLKLTREGGRPQRAEFRIEDSEAWPGRLDLGVGYNTGVEHVVLTAAAEQVAELRDALTAWLDSRPEA